MTASSLATLRTFAQDNLARRAFLRRLRVDMVWVGRCAAMVMGRRDTMQKGRHAMRGGLELPHICPITAPCWAHKKEHTAQRYVLLMRLSCQ